MHAYGQLQVKTSASQLENRQIQFTCQFGKLHARLAKNGGCLRKEAKIEHFSLIATTFVSLSEADTAAKLRFFRVSERLSYVTCRQHLNSI